MSHPVDLDEELAAIAARDADAFGRFLAGAEMELRKSLRGFASSVDVEAVVQETFLRVWQVAPRVVPDGRPNALLRFTVRVARNVAVDDLRKRREIAVADDLERIGAADEATPEPSDPLLKEVIARCVEALPTKPAEALRKRIESAGGDSDLTLAELLGMRLNTFLQNVTRAKKLVAECLEKKGVALDFAVRAGGAK
jgi:RNA polymerase sigma factor (sigma-70 family)